MSTPELERTPARPRSSPSPSWRPLVMRLHFYAGIFIAPFLVIAAVTGGLYAVAPTLESVVYRDLLHTDSTGAAVPVSDQIAAAMAVRPDLTVAAVRPAAESGDTTRVLFTNPDLGTSLRTAVFVDPVTATTLGESTVYGSSSSLPMRTWISELHRSLHLGEVGRLYSELAASWLWVVALGGLYLWVERYRRQRAKASDRARLVTVDRSATGRARTRSWHGVGGVWIFLGLLFLSATGLTWSAYAGENVTALRTALTWTTPSVTSTLGATDGAAHGDHGDHAGMADMSGASDVLGTNVSRIDDVLAIAGTHGIAGAVEASIPADADTASVVKETREAWAFSTDAIAVDARTGDVVDIVRFADWPLAAQLSAWGIALHMGILFGIANQLALLALVGVLITVIVRGYAMWFARRPTRGARVPVGRPPLRGGLRRIVLSPTGLRPSGIVAVVGLAVATVAVGWFLPVLGLSLLAFLVVDAVIGVSGEIGSRS